jgi:hypothetical protein
MHESAEIRDLSGYRRGLIATAGQVGRQVALDFDKAKGRRGTRSPRTTRRRWPRVHADALLQLVGQPSSCGVVGGVFKKAAKAGLIRCVGVTTSQRISGHGGLQRVWVGVM